MKRQRRPPMILCIRIKPGGFLYLPPWFLERAGWRIGDAVLMCVEVGRLIWSRFPDERAWRIDRLRQRIGSAGDPLLAVQTIKTLGDYRALSRAKVRTGLPVARLASTSRVIAVRKVK